MRNFLKISLTIVGFALMMGVADVQPAHAIPVTYSTSGSFSVNNGGGTFSGTMDGNGSSITFFGSPGSMLTISFQGITPPSTVEATPFTFASLGTFQTSVTGNGATIAPGTTFTLNITQTDPGSGSGSLVSTLTGTISQNQSTGQVTFTVAAVTINGVEYRIRENPLTLVPPATNNGMTTVQAQITAIPEPTTVLLLGTGLAGIAAGIRKRRKATT